MTLAPDVRTGTLWAFGTRGDAPALVDGDRVVSYDELERRVLDLRDRLGEVRRLVLLEARPDVQTVVALLAALAGEHPVLLQPECGASPEVLATYRPDVTLTGGEVVEHHPSTGHDLHPDLALLLSTSGSTGSPKLVRLSLAALRANAHAIAEYLDLTSADCGATTLPLQYCYGLSVLTSHLVAGARVVLTDASVVEDRLWDQVRRHRVTSISGVPHTFELLERSGFARRDLPSLRFLTQAGGRLAPEKVRAWARLGRRRGFQFFVMYGQTEATARMGYLPPHLAESRPGCIGVPIPGASWRVEEGELVFSGPNVMLGYATSAADLARGRTVHELRTGDLARTHADGLVEIIGRRSRFAKVFGLRIDLGRVEAEVGVPAHAVEHDGRVALFVRRYREVEAARADAVAAGVPTHGLDVHVVSEFPRTDSGKPDHGALARHAATLAAGSAPGLAPRPDPAQTAPRPGAKSPPTRRKVPADPAQSAGTATPAQVRDELALLLGRPDATEDDTFVGLGGDSLAYVEASVRLDRLVGGLPDDWPERTARELAAGTGRRTSLEVPVLLRALGIFLIVATHADAIDVMGGAHLLLAAAGFQLARFQLARTGRWHRVRGLLRSAAGVAVPSGLFIAAAGAVTGRYDLGTALFLNGVLGSETWDDRWQFWFLEVVVWAPVLVALGLAVPWLDRAERARPFAFAMGVVAATGALRFALAGVEAANPERYTVPVVLWCVAIGWAAARADTWPRRGVVATAAVALTVGFFGDPSREGIVIASILLLMAVRSVPVPRPLVLPVSLLASASLWIYLTHWQVYPHLEVDHPWLATFASLVVGVLAWAAYPRLRDLAHAPLHALRRSRGTLALWPPRPAASVGSTDGVV